MRILLLSKNTNYLEHKKIYGTENIVRVISDEMNKIGIDVQTITCNDNKKMLIKANKNPINYFSRGRLVDSSSFKDILRKKKA